MWRISNDEARTISAFSLPLPLPKMRPTLLPLSTATTTTELDNGDSPSALSLSLRYLPISSNSSDHSPSTPPLPDPSDFSFFSDFSPDVCYADELFGDGRLLPCKPQRPPAPSTKELSKIRNTKHLLFPHHRSASLNRASLRHAGRPRLRRATSDSDPSTTAPPQLRWYEVFMLGPGRFPGMVEMRELRSRQRRPQSPPTPTLQGSASLPWKLLQSLSCRGMESTAAITAGPRLI